MSEFSPDVTINDVTRFRLYIGNLRLRSIVTKSVIINETTTFTTFNKMLKCHQTFLVML